MQLRIYRPSFFSAKSRFKRTWRTKLSLKQGTGVAATTADIRSGALLNEQYVTLRQNYLRNDGAWKMRTRRRRGSFDPVDPRLTNSDRTSSRSDRQQRRATVASDSL